MIREAYAAYNPNNDFMPLSSIRFTPGAVKEWIFETYQSASAQKQMQIVKVSIRKLKE